jgi:hypothetical protein
MKMTPVYWFSLFDGGLKIVDRRRFLWYIRLQVNYTLDFFWRNPKLP